MAVLAATIICLVVCNTISALPSPPFKSTGGASPRSLASRSSSSSTSTLLAVTKTTIPPLISVPTYSMATCNDDGGDAASCTTTNMNILTYATPVSVRPDRIWAIGLFKDTLSYTNFCRTRSCVLQLLTEKHISLIKLLGGSSGNDVDKQSECEKLGFVWSYLPQGNSDDDVADRQQQQRLPMVLPDCAYYLKLTAMGDMVDCGSHVVAICKVQDMFANDNHDGDTMEHHDHLSTARLRELGIITDQGRVAD